jgi:MoxR-like ATPase
LTSKTLAHRIVLSYEAVADGLSEEEVIKEIINNVKVI